MRRVKLLWSKADLERKLHSKVSSAEVSDEEWLDAFRYEDGHDILSYEDKHEVEECLVT